MSNVVTGAGMGGLLGIGFAVLALVSTLRVEPTTDPGVRSVRIIGRVFIAGGAMLGLVVIVLAVTLESATSSAVGLAGGVGMGIGVFMVRRAGSRFDGPNPAPDPVAARSRAILGMAVAQAITVLAAVGLILAVMLAP